MRLRISIASAALLVVAACTAFDDVPEPKQPRVDSDHTEALDAAPATPTPTQATPSQADASSDAGAEAAARTCTGSTESFCVGDVLHHCSSTGDTVLYCDTFRTRCVANSATNATCN